MSETTVLLGNDDTRLTTISDLEALYGAPAERAVAKQLSRIDQHFRHFISLSPFMVIATAGPDGLADVSPKGDPPGFVKVLDDHRLAIPDRPGNRRLDSMRNLIDRPGIGLLFMIPGIDETLRINGTAEIHNDPALNAALAINGRPALSAIVVTVREAYMHCGKALMRSHLWDPSVHVPRDQVPTLGQMLRDQAGVVGPQTQEEIVAMYRKSLY